MVELIKIKTELSPKGAVESLRLKSSDFGFIIREVFDMGNEFKSHNIDVDDDFEYYSIMICNPSKAYASIKASKIRGAMLLPPKQIVVYSENQETFIAYMKMNKESIAQMVPADIKFQEGLFGSCNQIVKLIKSINE